MSCVVELCVVRVFVCCRLSLVSCVALRLRYVCVLFVLFVVGVVCVCCVVFVVVFVCRLC